MAEIDKMIPHILRWEVGLKGNEAKLAPRQMYDAVSKRGFHIIPGDRGGATMCGVTIGTFTDWRNRQGKPKPSVEKLKALQYDEWLPILKTLFWNPCKADDILNQSVAEMLVDWRWVNGTQAVRDAQAVLSCVPDGSVGPKTLAALNDRDSRSVFNRLRNARLRAYERIVQRSPSQKVFLKGWQNRTGSIGYRE